MVGTTSHPADDQAVFTPWRDYLLSPEAWGDEDHIVQPESLRPGCQPYVLRHATDQPRHAVVLLHGLSDSPWFLRAIARELHQRGGLDVYVPLLQGHGLKEPKGMHGVSHRIWLRNAAWALRQARRSASTLSLGGLSTGGALAALLAFRDQDGEDLISGEPRHPGAGQAVDTARVIDGGILLFSAALRLRNRSLIKGRTVEQILRSPIGTAIDIWKESSSIPDEGDDPLIGDHPYRYAYVDIGAAGELAQVIGLLDRKRRTRRWGDLRGLQQPLFIAHSDADTTADIRALQNLRRASAAINANNVAFFRIGPDFQVPHASVVLNQIAYGKSGSPLEPANPFFKAMIDNALASPIIKSHQS